MSWRPFRSAHARFARGAALSAAAIVAATTGCEAIVDGAPRTLEACHPGALRCGASVRERCDPLGQRFDPDPCPTDTPACVEGVCWACDPAVALGDDVLGDCARPLCVGGSVTSTADDSDVPSDGDRCTTERCEGGKPVVTFTAPMNRPCEIAKGASEQNACTRTPDGRVVCWGSNANGQLGLGSADALVHAPTVVVGLPPVRGVAVGCEHALAWTATGEAWGWGSNAHAETRAAVGPAAHDPVTITFDQPVLQMAAGCTHSCAVLADHTAMCWGENTHGQLGVGDADSRTSPTSVVGPRNAARLEHIKEIAAGTDSTCALLDSGDLYCWGLAEATGAGHPESDPDVVAPEWVASSATSISVGVASACAGFADGGVSCFGYNSFGQCGADPSAFVFASTPQTIDVGDATDSSPGFSHACAVVASGVACWGGNYWGQLGQGDGCGAGCPGDLDVTPAWVVGTAPGVEQVVASWIFSCALRAGEVSCWGGNFQGQLGDGTSSSGRDTAQPIVWPLQ
ncbi:MAG: hypothetical protein U0414_03205 [Polyangiaceae bacterium]